MTGDAYTPEQRETPAPRRQQAVPADATPTLTPQEADAAARQRTRAAKSYPLADEEDLRRSREQGGPHSDVPITDVSPPTD